MELNNPLKNMRFSSVLLASLTVSAALGWVGPAYAQVEVKPASELDESDGYADSLFQRAQEPDKGSEDNKPETLDTVGLTVQPLPLLHRGMGNGSAFNNVALPEQVMPLDSLEPLPRQTSDNLLHGLPLWAQAIDDPADPPPDTLQIPPPDAPDVPEVPEVDEDVLEEPSPDRPTDEAVDDEGESLEDEEPDEELELDGELDELELDDELEPDEPQPIGPELEEPESLPDEVIDETTGEEEEAVPSTEAEEEVEPRVLVAEVLVRGTEDQPQLEDIVYQAIETQPGRTTTRSQLQEDINSVFATGFFSNVEAIPEDTPLGVRITFLVSPNPVLSEVRVANSALQEQAEAEEEDEAEDARLEYEGERLTVQEVVDRIFSPQYGRTLNLLDFQDGIEELNAVYQENGYVLAQVVDAPPPENGVVTLVVAEGVIEDIEVAFLDEDGLAVDEEGNPIEGRTRDFIITREFESQPGDVFNQDQIQADLQQVFSLGIFDDVRVALNPGDDPRKVDVIVNVIEGNTGSVAAGVGFSSATGIFGSLSYQQQNLGGNNQRLGAEVQFGQRDILFDLRFTDPWIATDPYRTSYTINAFSRRSISLIFDGGDEEVELDNGDRPRVQRIGGGVSFSRPLDEWLGWEGWRASTGFQYQQVSIRDSDGDLEPEDELGNDLSFSGDGIDDLFTVQLAAVRDRRNSSTQPTSGSLLRFGTEQSLPLGSGSIFFNRLRASYSYYIPVSFTDFNDGPEALAFNVQAGTIIGDLPPYEAFSLGGTDSVRGYDAGDLGSGRSFLQATAEYRFPVFSIISGALFVDFGSDLGTADDVPGRPAEIRDKPGTGFGYGLGVRVQSPLGPIRIDYGINDDGDGRIHFGIGERF